MATDPPSAPRHVLHRIEDGVLVGAVGIMVALAAVQIVLRGVFGGGLLWIEPLLRSLVLWIGMLGALAASRTGRHIAIDVLTRALPLSWRLPLRGAACLFTVVVCIGLAWHGARFVVLEYGFAGMAFGAVPTWAVVVILPLAFGLIAVRYALFALAFFRGREPFGEAPS